MFLIKSLHHKTVFLRSCSQLNVKTRLLRPPTSHSEINVNELFKINKEDFDKIYATQIKADFSRLLETFNDHSIIIRQESIELKSGLEIVNSKVPVKRFILWGRKGVGKTIQLAYISHFAHDSGDWVLFNLIDTFNILHISASLVPSSRDDNIYDTPVESEQFLQLFLKINNNFINKYKPTISKSIHWNNNESLPQGTLWTEVIDFALKRTKYSSDCIEYLIKDAIEQSNSGQFKTLIVVKGINFLFQNSTRRDTDLQLIAANRLRILKSFHDVVSNQCLWNNGAVVGSLHPELTRDLKVKSNDAPLVLDRDVFIQLDPFIPIAMHDYTEKETSTYLQFLKENHWLTLLESNTPQGLEMIKFLAQNRPSELFEVTKEW